MAHLKTVYLAEKTATSALINYYARSIEKDFREVIVSIVLVAKSLIYTQLIQTEERLPDQSDPAPHSSEETQINRLVDLLGFEDCKTTCSKIRYKSRHESLNFVKAYVRTK